MLMYILNRISKRTYSAILAYIRRKNPSPYLLEYIFSFISALMLTILCCSFGLIIYLVKKWALYELLIFGALAMLYAGIAYNLFFDHAGWLYLLDKWIKQTKVVRGEIWDFRSENVNYSFVSPPSNSYLYYDAELCALRSWLYYRQEGEIVKRSGRVGYDERSIKTTDEKKLQRIRLVMTSPKICLLEELMAIEPPLEVEMVCWKRSKILIEFRPVEGLEYPPEALECLAAMNAMYP